MCIAECSIRWNILLISHTFSPSWRMLIRPGIRISEREEALSLRHAGRSPTEAATTEEEARGTGAQKPAHYRQNQETRKGVGPCQSDIR